MGDSQHRENRSTQSGDDRNFILPPPPKTPTPARMSQYPANRRPEFDRDSVISVNLTKKPEPSPAKLDQLSNARVRAAEARRIRQQNILETKLAQLRSLGDVSNEHLTRTCQLLIEAEKEGRRRQNTLVEDLNTHMETFGDQLLTIRRMVERLAPATRNSTASEAPPATQRRPMSPGRAAPRVNPVSNSLPSRYNNVQLLS